MTKTTTSIASTSTQRRRNEIAQLRLILEIPEQTNQTVDAVGTQVLLGHQAKLLLELRIAHRVLEVPAVILDPDGLACARFQHDLEFAEIELLLGAVGLLRWKAFDA